MADVCLILEGTYPFVTGGVSTWVQSLIEGLPEVSFEVVHLRDGDRYAGAAPYPVPANCTSVRQVLLDPDRDGLSPSIHHDLPDAGVYHSLSSGLAGAVGCQLATARRRPLVVTDHGVAWRECRMGSGELESGRRPAGAGGTPSQRQERRRAWETRLEATAADAYATAHTITTVCSANARLQRQLGARPERSVVIRNPVAAADHRAGPTERDGSEWWVGFVGRVVPLKDVATFIRACARVATRLPSARFAVIGPLDHDAGYAARCQELATEEGLDGRLVFPGETDPTGWYRRLDTVVLTSLSEGEPLVLLEAMAAGVPVIATAVGGCPELLGREPGRSSAAGLLTEVGNPDSTAAAMLAVHDQPTLRHRLVATGIERVRRLHHPSTTLTSYGSIYDRAVLSRRR